MNRTNSRDTNTLNSRLLQLIQKDCGQDQSIYIRLLKILHLVGSTGYPPLVEAAKSILDRHKLGKLWLPNLLQNVLLRISLDVSENDKISINDDLSYSQVDQLFLLKQLSSLLDDREIFMPLNHMSKIDLFIDDLCLGITRWLLLQLQLDNNHYLSQLLAEASERLGIILELDPQEFFQNGMTILSNAFNHCNRSGNTLFLDIPCMSDQVNFEILKKSSILDNLHSIQHLILNGYDAFQWLLHLRKEIHHFDQLTSIDLKVIRTEELLLLNDTRLIDLIYKGVASRSARTKLSPELIDELSQKEKADELIFIAERSSPQVSSNLSRLHFKLIYIPSGEYQMGSFEGVGFSQEWPRHSVKLTHSYALWQTPVTQEQWYAVMKSQPSKHQGSTHPVDSVTWLDAIQFCNTLSHLEGLEPVYVIKEGSHPNVQANFNCNGYRLPTEAEWEYAAKAGTESIFSGSDNQAEVGWLYDQDQGSSPVALKKANPWGLYDMSGNVWEWTQDTWNYKAYQSRSLGAINPIEQSSNESKRTRRGGGWRHGDGTFRTAMRGCYSPSDSRADLGFRPIRLSD